MSTQEVFVTDLNDARLLPYRGLKSTNLTRWSGRFIAEGWKVVQRLLESDFETESILVSEEELARHPELRAARAVLYVVPPKLAEELVGFQFHCGVLACGRRREPWPLEQWYGKPVNELSLPKSDTGGTTDLIVVCPHLTDPENLGSLIRLCAAFGVRGLLLGEACADPFSRRVLRVSMGTAFSIPILESQDLRQQLEQLRSQGQFRLAATVLAPTAKPLSEIQQRPKRLAILLGNEAHGLDESWLRLCDDLLTIPMSGGTDSLNVTVAAGIFLHHFRCE